MPKPDPITRVGLHLCRVKMGVSYAKHNLTDASVLVVELTIGDLTGWGEVFCPQPDVLWNWAVRVAPLLVGQDATERDALLDKFPPDRPKMRAEDCSVYCHPDVDPVAEAYSIALHDAVSRRRGISFGALLGSVQRRIIPGMPVITLGAPEEMAAAAQAWSAAGIRFLKIKLHGEATRDCAIVEAVRAAAGDTISLQVDANGAYSDLASALPLIAMLNRHHIDIVEDLFDVGNLELCRSARQRLDGRYMVDKDAHWPHVENVIAAGAADLINQHPHNQGRMSYALNIAESARRAGIETAIGSSGILGVQSAAFQHLASVIGLSRPCEDIGMMSYYDGPVGNRYNFTQRPTILREPVRLTAGTLQISSAPGLGIEVDRDALDRLTLRQMACDGVS